MSNNQQVEAKAEFWQHWFFRYKLYHIPFWFAYHVTWWAITMGSISQAIYNILFSVFTIKFLFYFVFQAIGVYFNLYFLIPHFLQKGKYITYILLLLFTIICTAICIVPGYYLTAYLANIPFKELFYHDPNNFMHFFSVNALPSTVASATLGMSVKLTKNWIESERKQQILEKEKLETELKYLKSQFNPHFLFNTINSIFVLIHKNPDLASESLATFSDLLRYQLYECNENEIELERELRFLDDFIQLEKLRLDEQHTDLQFDIKNQTEVGQTIAPFILMPFIENAFKHVSKGKRQKNHISMSLQIIDNQLLIEIENSVSSEKSFSKEILKNKGIGLKNVKRRLDLLYPKRYELNIENLPNTYKIQLKLELNAEYITN